MTPKDPLASNGFLPRSRGNKFPGAIADKSIELGIESIAASEHGVGGAWW